MYSKPVKDNNKLKVLIDEQYLNWKMILRDLLPILEYKRIKDYSEIANIDNSEKLELDVIVFDIAENKSSQLKEINSLRTFNPDIKTILFTTEKNRRFRTYYLSRGIDFLIFKEAENELLGSIIKQLHLRKTKFEK